MRKLLLIALLCIALLVVACGPQAQPTEDVAEEENMVDDSAEEMADHEDSMEDTEEEANIELHDDEMDEGELDVPIEGVLAGDWCIAGTTYTYPGDSGVAEVLGLEEFKGQEFCKAHAEFVESSELGDLTTATTYYYDEPQLEFWLVTTISGGVFTEPQTTETHIVNGEVVE